MILTPQVPVPAPMSQPSASQSQRNESVGGDACETPNGIENTNSDESHPTPDFGIFDDQVQLGLKKLQGGVLTVDSAVAELTKTFDKHEDIVKAVRKRWGQDKSLEEEIHDLKVAKDEVWNRLEESRKTHKKKIADLKREHGKEVSRLETEANEGQQEKAKYEGLQRSLKDQHDTAMQKMDTELKQKKTEIELESTGKIAALEKEKRELEDAKARLEGDLIKKTNELDQEKETRKTMQDKLSGDIRELQKTLSDIKAKYEMEEKSLKFYLEKYQHVVQSVGKIADSYFKSLPNKAIDDPVATSKNLARRAPSFAKVPISNSECSDVLRLANAQHVIFNAICGLLWQPFSSKHLLKSKWDRSALVEIHARLAAHGEDVQQNWKVSTLKILAELDDGVDVGGQIDAMISDKVVACLQPLLDDSMVVPFTDELKAVFMEALELGKMAERDRLPVYVDTTPSGVDPEGWREYLDEDDEIICDRTDLSASSPTMDSPEPLFVTPKIFRRGAGAAAMGGPPGSATSATAATATTVIHQGLALFPRTGIFQEGLLEWERISSAGREAAKNATGKVRRQSTSTSMTNSGILPRSPQLSRRWSRDGARGFD